MLGVSLNDLRSARIAFIAVNANDSDQTWMHLTTWTSTRHDIQILSHSLQSNVDFMLTFVFRDVNLLQVC